jgi:hypothetical protein
MTSFGLKVAMAFMQMVLIVLRNLIAYLPAKDARELQSFEENLNHIAYDADKLLLPGHLVLMSAFGWCIVYQLFVDPVFDIVETFMGW